MTTLPGDALPVSRWRFLGVVAPGLDAGTGFLGSRHRRAMAGAEVAACTSILATLPTVVADWSDGNVALEAHFENPAPPRNPTSPHV